MVASARDAGRFQSPGADFTHCRDEEMRQAAALPQQRPQCRDNTLYMRPCRRTQYASSFQRVLPRKFAAQARRSTSPGRRWRVSKTIGADE